MSNSRIVLVTGGSRGIGEAISMSFAKDGDIVVVNYLSNKAQADKVVAKIQDSGGKAVALKADVSRQDEVLRIMDDIVERYRRIDVLVNNAGTTKDGLLMLMSEGDWDCVIDVNLKGVFNCCKAVSRHMIAERSGTIINISSMSGITGLAGQCNYSAAKGGVIAFTKAIAKELAEFGIRVNAVAPGMIDTDITYNIPEKIRAELLEMIPLKRFGTPEEVAGVVKFLASKNADYITGETIVVSGGLP